MVGIVVDKRPYIAVQRLRNGRIRADIGLFSDLLGLSR